MPMNPLVSIIVPIYNGEQYIKGCIDSIVTQTYSNIELILVNDGSTDGSKDVIQYYTDIDTRCVHMSYLQLGLAGIPAVIFHRDALSLETWDRWETPAYIMQYTRFKDVFKGTPSDWRG